MAASSSAARIYRNPRDRPYPPGLFARSIRSAWSMAGATRASATASSELADLGTPCADHRRGQPDGYNHFLIFRGREGRRGAAGLSGVRKFRMMSVEKFERIWHRFSRLVGGLHRKRAMGVRLRRACWQRKKGIRCSPRRIRTSKCRHIRRGRRGATLHQAFPLAADGRADLPHALRVLAFRFLRPRPTRLATRQRSRSCKSASTTATR